MPINTPNQTNTPPVDLTAGAQTGAQSNSNTPVQPVDLTKTPQVASTGQVTSKQVKKDNPYFKYIFMPGNLPDYQHFCECLLCPFQTRMSTKEAAVNQITSHVTNVHSVKSNDIPVEV